MWRQVTWAGCWTLTTVHSLGGSHWERRLGRSRPHSVVMWSSRGRKWKFTWNNDIDLWLPSTFSFSFQNLARIKMITFGSPEENYTVYNRILYNCTKKRTVNGKTQNPITGLCCCNKVNGPGFTQAGRSPVIVITHYCKVLQVCNFCKNSNWLQTVFFVSNIPVLSHGTIGRFSTLFIDDGEVLMLHLRMESCLKMFRIYSRKWNVDMPRFQEAWILQLSLWL